MSASREKKQRQGSGPDPRAARAQQEQAARKRKITTYSVIAVVVVVLVAALLIWNSNFFQRRVAGVTVGDETLSVAELSYYYYGARSSYLNTYYYYYYYLGYSIPDDSDVLDTDTGKTYRDYYMETALTNAATVTALYDGALAHGYTMSDVQDDLDAEINETKASASSNGYSYAAYLRAVYGSYITTAAYEKMLGQNLLASLYYSDHAEELSQSYSESDLEAWYTDNSDAADTFEYSYLLIRAAEVEEEDADGNELDEDAVAELKEAAMAEAKAKAEEAQAAYEDGAEVADLIEEYEPSSSVDHYTVIGSSISSSAVYHDKLMEMKDGDSAIVEASSGYYLVILHSRALDETPTRNVRHILIRAETTTDDDGNLVAPSEEAWAAALEKVESIQAEYEAGAKTEDAFAALANEYSDDGGSNTTGGLYTQIATTDSYVTEFLDWIFEDGRQVGDVGLVRHEGDAESSYPSYEYWGYHLMYLAGDDEPQWMLDARSALTSDALTEWTELLTQGYPTALAAGAAYLGK